VDIAQYAMMLLEVADDPDAATHKQEHARLAALC
jgi:hypothetical protein